MSVEERLELPKMVIAIRKIIKDWIDGTPSFTSKYSGRYIVVNDSVYRTHLAVIKLEDDHLEVNLPYTYNGAQTSFGPPFNDVKHTAFADYVDGIRSDLLSANPNHVLYSDPELHTRVKYLVNQAYNRQ
jgi:hypothetical protein